MLAFYVEVQYDLDPVFGGAGVGNHQQVQQSMCAFFTSETFQLNR